MIYSYIVVIYVDMNDNSKKLFSFKLIKSK